MTQKRFRKLLMGHGMSHRAVRYIMRAYKDSFHYMENRKCFVIDEDDFCKNRYWYDDTKTEELRFKEFRVLPYAENYRRLAEGRLMYIYDFPFARPIVGWNGFHSKGVLQNDTL